VDQESSQPRNDLGATLGNPCIGRKGRGQQVCGDGAAGKKGKKIVPGRRPGSTSKQTLLGKLKSGWAVSRPFFSQGTENRKKRRSVGRRSKGGSAGRECRGEKRNMGQGAMPFLKLEKGKGNNPADGPVPLLCSYKRERRPNGHTK